VAVGDRVDRDLTAELLLSPDHEYEQQNGK
jgi:hypothetical protein